MINTGSKPERVNIGACAFCGKPRAVCTGECK